MSSIANNIDARSKNLNDLLANQKYEIDYFQREYRWQRKHIEQLLTDLESSFLSNYEPGHSQADVAEYNCYYMGPVVLCNKKSAFSIVDGQQRLTSLTLLCIYLNNAQQQYEEKEELYQLIYSKKFGKVSFNLDVKERFQIMDNLLNRKSLEDVNWTNESVVNISERYTDIENLFPEELSSFNVLPLFIEWIKQKLIFVEIMAYTDENAYTIFETMNDRGLNLSPSEMLKGYLLANVKDPDKIAELNQLWISQLSKLHQYSSEEDMEFFRAWLRAKYANSMRSSSKGAPSEDFEKIGTSFHAWVRDNVKKLNLKAESDFYYFIKSDFDFFSNLFLRIVDFEWNLNMEYALLNQITYYNIASSLFYGLLLAPVTKVDNEHVIREKIRLISTYIDMFIINRSLAGKSLTQSTIRYTIYSLVKEIRNLDVTQLSQMLFEKAVTFANDSNEFASFEVSIANRKFVHYLFARIEWLKQSNVGINRNFGEFMPSRRRNSFLLYQFIDNQFVKNFFDQQLKEDEAPRYMNKIGTFILLPKEIVDELEDMSVKERVNRLYLDNFLSENEFFNYNEQDISTFLNRRANYLSEHYFTQIDSVENLLLKGADEFETGS